MKGLLSSKLITQKKNIWIDIIIQFNHFDFYFMALTPYFVTGEWNRIEIIVGKDDCMTFASVRIYDIFALK